MGLRCVCECIFISLDKPRGFAIMAMEMLPKPAEDFVRFTRCELFILRGITPCAEEVEIVNFVNFFAVVLQSDLCYPRKNPF